MDQWQKLGDLSDANLPIHQPSVEGIIQHFNEVVKMDMPKIDPIDFDLVELSLPGEIFKLVLPEYYELDGHIFYAVPIKGQGLADFDLHNLQLKGTIYLKKATNSPDVVIDKFEDAEINIERVVSRTEFDHNIDKIISALVEDLLAGYINRFNKYILFTYSETIIEYINRIITNIKLS
ncbi:unnamed protein product [Arctia plantaginis]|uniref:Uncharacterized protein n=1 Tax=Arctia plantaginis TaxID=874455 RepID=A0A8S1AKN6_ARCPL|nr:unnamed protein product [Arctia plantaginis]